MDSIELFDTWSLLKEKAKKITNPYSYTYLGFYKCSFGYAYIGINKICEMVFYLEISPDESNLFKFKDYENIEFMICANESLQKDKTFLKIKTKNNSMSEIFESFTVSCILAIHDDEKFDLVYNDLLSVLDRYNKFLSNKAVNKLSKIEEQGLFGELMFLKEVITNCGETYLRNWSGPDKNRNDYIFNSGTAVEVKTSFSETRMVVEISNENQLSNVGREKLFLVVYVLEENQLGKTIIDLAKDIYTNLLHSYEIKEIFKKKLMLYGINFDSYQTDRKMQIFKRVVYLVDDYFPKIIKDSLSKNIYDVQYKIELSSIDQYEGDLYGCIK